MAGWYQQVRKTILTLDKVKVVVFTAWRGFSLNSITTELAELSHQYEFLKSNLDFTT